MSRDTADVHKLQEQIRRFHFYDRECKDLMCVSTNDAVPDDIKKDSERGLEMNQFVKKHLFQDAITIASKTQSSKTNLQTFASIHNVKGHLRP